MASTYTTLLAEVAAYLARADLTSTIPTFVQFAQLRINREVKAKAMETKSTSFSITGEYVNVPSDFREVKSFYIPGSPRTVLELGGEDEMTRDYQTTSKPKYFSVDGSQFRFAPIPDSTYTATLVYYANPATLATTTQETNSLFPSVAADLYLYASLLEAEAYIQNDPRLATWKAAYDEGVEKLNRVNKKLHNGSSLTTRPDSATP